MTPSYIIEAARFTMRSIDLDPCSSAQANEIVKAAKFYTVVDDGLSLEWFGNVWVNWPYGRTSNRQWAERLAYMYESGRIKSACCINFVSTSEGWFQNLKHYPRFELRERVDFINPLTGLPVDDSPRGSAVFYLGLDLASFYLGYHTYGNLVIPIGASREIINQIPQVRALQEAIRNAQNPISAYPSRRRFQRKLRGARRNLLTTSD